MSDIKKVKINNTTYDVVANSVNGHIVNSDVPANAKFTDTVTTASTIGSGNAVTDISANNGALTVTKDITFLTSHQDISGKEDKSLKVQNITSSSTDEQYPSAKAVYNAIQSLPEPMIFKGSLGTGGTVTSLPTAASSNTGWTYKVITAGTYASQAAKVGDTFISDGSAWVLIPSGDEPSGTVISVTLNATSPIQINSTAAITSSGTRTLSHANSGATAGSYGDNALQTPDFGGTFKVPYITVNATGHVTSISDHTVKIPELGTMLVDMFYPVGTIYQTTDANFNPNASFGGTWVSWGAGKTIVGVDTTDKDFNSAEKTGGHKKSELVAWIGQIDDNTATLSFLRANHANWETKYPPAATKSSTYNSMNQYYTGMPGKWTNTTIVTDENGKDISLLQPYITCYMWKRIL